MVAKITFWRRAIQKKNEVTQFSWFNAPGPLLLFKVSQAKKIPWFNRLLFRSSRQLRSQHAKKSISSWCSTKPSCRERGDGRSTGRQHEGAELRGESETVKKWVTVLQPQEFQGSSQVEEATAYTEQPWLWQEPRSWIIPSLLLVGRQGTRLHHQTFHSNMKKELSEHYKHTHAYK